MIQSTSVTMVPKCDSCGYVFENSMKIYNHDIGLGRGPKIYHYEFVPNVCPNCGRIITTVENTYPEDYIRKLEKEENSSYD